MGRSYSFEQVHKVNAFIKWVHEIGKKLRELSNGRINYLPEGGMVCKGIITFNEYTPNSYNCLYIQVTKKMSAELVEKFENYLKLLSADEIVDKLIEKTKELSKTDKRYHWTEDNYKEQLAKRK